MNRVEAGRRAAIMAAWAAGKVIQYRVPVPGGMCPWVDCEGVESAPTGNMSFDFGFVEYRLKPEPTPKLVMYVAATVNRNSCCIPRIYQDDAEHDAKVANERWSTSHENPYEVVTLIEEPKA